MASAPRAAEGDGNVFTCALERIVPNREQPRQAFDEHAREQLAESIRQHGLIEPIVVRRLDGRDQFEIIAGERRWRACQKAGLREALVVVREVSDKNAYELALIENIQREDLNAIEFAHAVDNLLREHGYTQERLAERLGKDRSTLTNAIRLLKLPIEVRSAVISGQLSEGHARALLGAPSEAALVNLSQRVINGKLSVRQTEEAVRALKSNAPGKGKKGKNAKKSVSTRDLETRLSRHLGSRCEVQDRDGKGALKIHYADLDDLDRILDVILR